MTVMMVVMVMMVMMVMMIMMIMMVRLRKIITIKENVEEYDIMTMAMMTLALTNWSCFASQCFHMSKQFVRIIL